MYPLAFEHFGHSRQVIGASPEELLSFVCLYHMFNNSLTHMSMLTHLIAAVFHSRYAFAEIRAACGIVVNGLERRVSRED